MWESNILLNFNLFEKYGVKDIRLCSIVIINDYRILFIFDFKGKMYYRYGKSVKNSDFSM